MARKDEVISGSPNEDGRTQQQAPSDAFADGPIADNHQLNSDPEMQRAIAEAIFADSDIAASDVKVQIEEGVVRLTGEVDTIDIKYRLEDLAKRFSGRVPVENNLTVRAGDISSSADVDRLEDELSRVLEIK